MEKKYIQISDGSFVALEEKAWDESEHPRDPGGQGGGQFIAKTATGKKIYNKPANSSEYDNFNKQEHADAARAHKKEADRLAKHGINFHEKTTKAREHIEIASQHTKKVMGY